MIKDLQSYQLAKTQIEKLALNRGFDSSVMELVIDTDNHLICMNYLPNNAVQKKFDMTLFIDSEIKTNEIAWKKYKTTQINSFQYMIENLSSIMWVSQGYIDNIVSANPTKNVFMFSEGDYKINSELVIDRDNVLFIGHGDEDKINIIQESEGLSQYSRRCMQIQALLHQFKFLL